MQPLLVKNKGFTLIEVMLAVSVLSFGLMFIIQAYLMALNGLSLSWDYIGAVSFIKDKLNDLELYSYVNKGIVPAGLLDSTEGYLGQTNRKFKLTSQIEEISCGDKLIDEKLVEVWLRVTWQERNKSRQVSLVTYLPRRQEEQN